MLLFLLSFNRDIGKVVEALYGENPPPIMIIGHSMGGAIAVHAAAANHIPSLLGLCVIDVVEGLCFLKSEHQQWMYFSLFFCSVDFTPTMTSSEHLRHKLMISFY